MGRRSPIQKNGHNGYTENVNGTIGEHAAPTPNLPGYHPKQNRTKKIASKAKRVLSLEASDERKFTISEKAPTFQRGPSKLF